MTISAIITPTLGYDWHPDDVPDPAGWWMSEKYDGVRGLWDDRRLWTRSGHPIDAPRWWLDHLTPGRPLDGEIFIPGGTHRDAAPMVRTGADHPAWPQARFMAFDIPLADAAGHGAWIAGERQPDAPAVPIEQRIDELAELGGNAVRRIVPHRPCFGVDDLAACLADVLGRGGEGVVLRAPRSVYWPGRTPQFVKVKAAQRRWLPAVEPDRADELVAHGPPVDDTQHDESCETPR